MRSLIPDSERTMKIHPNLSVFLGIDRYLELPIFIDFYWKCARNSCAALSLIPAKSVFSRNVLKNQCFLMVFPSSWRELKRVFDENCGGIHFLNRPNLRNRRHLLDLPLFL